MKAAIYIYALVLGMAFVGCKSDSGSSPQPPASTEAPATTVAPPTTVAASCPQAGVGSYKCYDWGSCKGIFYSKDEAIAALRLNDKGGCHKIDGQVLPEGGFGPCSECQAYSSAGAKSMSVPMSFKQLLESRKK
jgi:hypothetical protein